MSKSTENTPLCANCELRRTGLDEFTAIELRDRAAYLQYEGDITTEPSDIPIILAEEFKDRGVSEETAYAAAECLGKVYRNNCPTAKIGFATPEEIGIVSR